MLLVKVDHDISSRTTKDAVLAFARHWLWRTNLRLQRTGAQSIALVAMCIAGLTFRVLRTLHDIQNAGESAVTVFFAVGADLTEVHAEIAWILAILTTARLLLPVLVGLVDIVFFKRITGRAFDWESMINAVLISGIFRATALLNPAIAGLLAYYAGLMSHIPTIVKLSGPLGLLMACLVADFSFYWAHRWGHKIRFLWNLGHINHHRTKNLSQLTMIPDPRFVLLSVFTGGGIGLLLLPLLTKIFTADLTGAGWAFVGVMVIDCLLEPSHSVCLYYAEALIRPLRWLRWIFITPAVHYIHHGRDPKFNLSDGSNFGARFSIWDRLFGTYAEPPEYVPETGLFGPNVDDCQNPVRYVLQPFVRMAKELRVNKIVYWPAILFGPATYEPPVTAGLPH